MRARLAFLVLAFICGCDRAHSTDATLAELPHKAIATGFDGFVLSFAPDGDTCGELDPAKTQATLNGERLAINGKGGASLTIKGRWEGTCESIDLDLGAAPPSGPAVLQLEDASQTLIAAWDAFGDPRELTPEFDGGASPGEVLRFALTPVSDTLSPPLDAGFESTSAELVGTDGGSRPLELVMGQHELQVTLPGDVVPGPATLALHGVSSRNPPTRCEGFEACSVDGHGLDARFTIVVAP